MTILLNDSGMGSVAFRA